MIPRMFFQTLTATLVVAVLAGTVQVLTPSPASFTTASPAQTFTQGASDDQ